MRNEDKLHSIPDLNILEKIFFQFYSEKISELPETKEHKIALKNEKEKQDSFIQAMDNECREKYYEYDEVRNRVESHMQYQGFLLGIKFANEMKKIIR